jgi:hypothetical protein
MVTNGIIFDENIDDVSDIDPLLLLLFLLLGNEDSSPSVRTFMMIFDFFVWNGLNAHTRSHAGRFDTSFLGGRASSYLPTYHQTFFIYITIYLSRFLLCVVVVFFFFLYTHTDTHTTTHTERENLFSALDSCSLLTRSHGGRFFDTPSSSLGGRKSFLSSSRWLGSLLTRSHAGPAAAAAALIVSAFFRGRKSFSSSDQREREREREIVFIILSLIKREREREIFKKKKNVVILFHRL